MIERFARVDVDNVINDEPRVAALGPRRVRLRLHAVRSRHVIRHIVLPGKVVLFPRIRHVLNVDLTHPATLFVHTRLQSASHKNICERSIVNLEKHFVVFIQ